MIGMRFLGLGLLAILLIAACAGTQNAPDDPHDLCEIFRENPEWYESAHESFQRWGTPIPVLMAIMYKESGYRAKARPPRTTCLCVLPGPRPSSAYGYSQAVDETWKRYQAETGRWGADRDDFSDSVDFIGWYCYQSRLRCGIAANDAYSLYLAYHEGQEGFNGRSYRGNRWLLAAAGRVQRRANIYASQLARCEEEFQKGGGCCLWPF